MKQLLMDIKAHRLCHKTDPPTSHEAAQKMVESGKLKTQRFEVLSLILNYIQYHDNFTAKELAKHAWKFKAYEHLDYHKIQRRLHELTTIERTGEKRGGCAVWRLK